MTRLARTARAFDVGLRQDGALRRAAKVAARTLERSHHALGAMVPGTIVPRPRQITIAVTAHCNLRCSGCNYPKGFMQGAQLPLGVVTAALDDAWDAGAGVARLYGGEPLLHRDLPSIVAHAVQRGFRTYVTSNGTHLRSKVDALYEAGLRLVTIGFYGVDAAYDAYVQRPGHYRRLEDGVGYLRDRYGDAIELQLNFVLARPTCTPEALAAAWHFAERFDMAFHIDLVSFSIPFFNPGPGGELAFRDGDGERIASVVEQLLALQREAPARLVHSPTFLRSIPDWLLKKERMRVPCDAYDMVWVGADGSVQLCDVAFPLGNLQRQRLRDILFGAGHRKACRDGFALNCPNCTCKVETRIQKHWPSLLAYRNRGAAAP